MEIAKVLCPGSIAALVWQPNQAFRSCAYKVCASPMKAYLPIE